MVTRRSGKEKARRPVATSGRASGKSLDPTLWADVAKLFASVPDSEWADVPSNASAQFDDIIESEGLA
jgi:hypothetical protein